MDEKNKMKLVDCLYLKTGTKVRIRKWEDLKKEEHLHCGFNSDMIRCCGKIVTIKKYSKEDFRNTYGLVRVYFFEESKDRSFYMWTWTNQMIELLNPKSKDQLNKI